MSLKQLRSRARGMRISTVMVLFAVGCSEQTQNSAVRIPCALIQRNVEDAFPVTFTTTLGEVVIHHPVVEFCSGGPFATMCARVKVTHTGSDSAPATSIFRGSCSLSYDAETSEVRAWP